MGGNNHRTHSMIVTDEELEEDFGDRCQPEEYIEDNFSSYDVPDIPGAVPESHERSMNQKAEIHEKRKDKKRNQSTNSAYHEYDGNKKYSQSQSKSRSGRGRGEKDKKPRGKRYSENNESSYPKQHISAKDEMESHGIDKWGDDTLYWVPENDNGDQSTQAPRNVSQDNRSSDPRRLKQGPSQPHDIERGQHVQYRELEAQDFESNYPPNMKARQDASSSFIDPGVAFNRPPGFASAQRATLPAIPPHRPMLDQPIRLLPHCPVRQVMTDHGQTVIPRRKLPQIPTTKPTQPSNFFDKLFRHSINVDSITKQENPDGSKNNSSNLHQSNPDVHYLSLPRNNPPQQLTARQLPTAPVLGARRTFSFTQPLYSPGDDEGRRSPSQRFSYHEALRGGRTSAVPFRHATFSGNQVQFQDQYSSLPRERNVPRNERYNSLQGSHRRNYSAARPASYDPRRLSFHEQGRPHQAPSTEGSNKRFSLRADNRFPARENMAALHVVGNQQGFHYPLNTKPKRLSGQNLGKFDQRPDEPSPPPAVANITPSETATEPDYDVYEVPQSIDDESMNSQDRYDQEINTFVPDVGSAFNPTLSDVEPSGRKTSMGRGYKDQRYWHEEDDRAERRERVDADVTDIRQAPLRGGYQPRDTHYQEEDEAARRERLRQNLQKQISEEATGTTTMSIGNRLTKQGSCDYHGAGAASLELDYEYDEPEQLGFYHMPESDAYEREYTHSYDAKNQGDSDIDRHLDELQEQQYQYDRQHEESKIEMERRYRQPKHDNEGNDEVDQRAFGLDMRVRRATERTLAQELSEAYVEEGYVDDYQDEHTYPTNQRQATAYQGAVASDYYYDDENTMQQQRGIDDVPERRQYRSSKEGFERNDNDEILYEQTGADNNQRYYQDESRQRYQEDECEQMYSRRPGDHPTRGNRNRYDYCPTYERGRGQKLSTSSNLGRERTMSDIMEGSSQVLSPSEEDQQYLTSEDSQRLNPKRQKDVDEGPLISPASPRHRRRVADDYSDVEANSSYKSRGKKDPQKIRSTKTGRHEPSDKQSRKQHPKEQSRRRPPEEEEILIEDDYPRPHERKNKGARPRKSEDNKPRKHHIEKKTEYEGSDLGISDTQPPAPKKSTRKSTSSRHQNEDKQNQRRHQSQIEEQDASGTDSHRQRRQRQSIRRQRPVETAQPTSESIHRTRHSSSTRTGEICEDMVEDDGDCFGSDEFNYDRDGQGASTGNRSSGSNMKYMDDRSNCRKK